VAGNGERERLKSGRDMWATSSQAPIPKGWRRFNGQDIPPKPKRHGDEVRREKSRSARHPIGMKIWSIGFRKEFLVEDDFAVTSQDLVDGLNRSSGAARVLGLNLDQTIAILTVMREATGRTGKEVGKKVAA